MALHLGPPDSRRWTISSWRGASVDDERERERKLERGVLLTCFEGSKEACHCPSAKSQSMQASSMLRHRSFASCP